LFSVKLEKLFEGADVKKNKLFLEERTVKSDMQKRVGLEFFLSTLNFSLSTFASIRDCIRRFKDDYLETRGENLDTYGENQLTVQF
jgi:CTP-dependent riboflavin kinase